MIQCDLRSNRHLERIKSKVCSPEITLTSEKRNKSGICSWNKWSNRKNKTSFRGKSSESRGIVCLKEGFWTQNMIKMGNIRKKWFHRWTSDGSATASDLTIQPNTGSTSALWTENMAKTSCFKGNPFTTAILANQSQLKPRETIKKPN